MSISIDSLSSYIDTTKNTTSGSGLEKTLNKDFSSASDEELMDVCKEFESYFFEQVLKEVEKTIPKAEDEDSSTTQLREFYMDSVRQDISAQIAEQSGNKIAQTMYEQMKRNYNI